MQLDCDVIPSTFDAVVAVDAEVDVLLRHGGVTPENVVPLVHGAMFTRGGDDLRHTAIFVGGSDVTLAEAVRDAVVGAFFGPVRVGVMLDPSGANTTAVAAVLAASRHVALPGSRAVVLGGTGPVGQRVARLLARRGATVEIVSRSASRAAKACAAAIAAVPKANVLPLVDDQVSGSLAVADIVIAAGAAGARLTSLESVCSLRNASAGNRRSPDRIVLIDLNAVPPAGIEGVAAGDKARPISSQGCDMVVYGALGIGGTKMKIHRRGIETLFQSNGALLDAEELLEVGEVLEASRKG